MSMKVIAYGWRFMWDRVPIIRRRNILNSDPRCVLCGATEETGNHIFFECMVSYDIWIACFRWLGASTALHSHPYLNIVGFSSMLSSKLGKYISIAIWLCMT